MRWCSVLQSCIYIRFIWKTIISVYQSTYNRNVQYCTGRTLFLYTKISFVFLIGPNHVGLILALRFVFSYIKQLLLCIITSQHLPQYTALLEILNVFLPTVGQSLVSIHFSKLQKSACRYLKLAWYKQSITVSIYCFPLARTTLSLCSNTVKVEDLLEKSTADVWCGHWLML